MAEELSALQKWPKVKWQMITSGEKRGRNLQPMSLRKDQKPETHIIQ